MYLVCLDCLEETLALIKGNMRRHNGISDQPRNGSSTKLLVAVVISDCPEQLTL